ncbi:carboxymuconolactone decarboxylase family protein [Parvularcula lutaonensis]|uniref:Alkyl hydroperoxide reductase AhpD n=1 Tax=Parvularcula lutaonensis TaxID=491923 RepID=A0ABV7MCT3_9PROT|nr:carboxymuconolactone decarboxylase family protein [Parvularcula lutaonensis]GGY51607.1 alkyl hydroperoxide reductase AhpD [Parvularcula lutaonensis]
MSLEALREQLPDYAKDIKLNLGNLASEDILDEQKRWGTFLSCAITGRSPDVIKAIAAEAESRLSPEAVRAAKAAAGIMAMNNVFYRFGHEAGNEVYKTMPAKLRMTIIGNPGVDKVDFELWSLAVSSINGCFMCVDSHEAIVRKAGVTSEQIQAAVRIAAVVQAASTIIEGEKALAG